MRTNNRGRWSIATVLVGLTVATATATTAHAADGYVQTNLISNISGLAAHTDPDLRNPWGIAFFPGLSPFWVNNNGAGTSALYFATGAPFPLLPSVTIPPGGSSTDGTPTGIVANFLVLSGAFQIPVPAPGTGTFGPALFIFATEDGTIQAWNINPPISPGIPDVTRAVIVANNSAGGAVYKGLAMGTNSDKNPQLYATNFRSGKIDVFDTNFHQVTLSNNTFKDPKLQDGYAPFGIQNIHGNLWVTYALQDAEKMDDVAKPAHGFVDVFDTDGNLLLRFAQHGHLNAPWGVALAPASFGTFSNDILIGNFGDGTINAYDPKSGHWLGTVSDVDGRPIVNEGLWGLTFGGALNSAAPGDVSSPNTLYFSAGLNDEADGLFGSIQAE
jgi:uncharacterized protein (TIGR03118 family)